MSFFECLGERVLRDSNAVAISVFLVSLSVFPPHRGEHNISLLITAVVGCIRASHDDRLIMGFDYDADVSSRLSG